MRATSDTSSTPWTGSLGNMAAETIADARAPSGPDRKRGRGRVVISVLGGVLLAVAGTGLAVHWLDTGHRLLLIAASAAYLLAPASVVGLVLFLVARQWILVVCALVLIGLQVVAYGPLFVGETAPADSDDVTVMTQNMLYGRADPQSIVARLKTEDVDVLAVEELTPAAVKALQAAGIGDVMPYGWWRSAPGATGTGLWSRYPFVDPVAERGFSMFTVTARMELPTGQRVSLVAVHPSAPYPQSPREWLDDYASLRSLLHDRLPGGPVIVAGDFNATWDHANFRSLLTGGYRDAAEQSGAGLVRTWPADRYVPLIGIDHVLTRGAVATSFDVVATPRTDHRGVVSTVAIPRT